MNYIVTEDQTNISITIRVLEVQAVTILTFDITVLVSENNSATEGEDFILLDHDATIGPEMIETAVGFQIIDDSTFEGRESFTVELSSCCDAHDQIVSIEPSLATINIQDDGKICSIYGCILCGL